MMLFDGSDIERLETAVLVEGGRCTEEHVHVRAVLTMRRLDDIEAHAILNRAHAQATEMHGMRHLVLARTDSSTTLSVYPRANSTVEALKALVERIAEILSLAVTTLQVSDEDNQEVVLDQLLVMGGYALLPTLNLGDFWGSWPPPWTVV